jgi:hydroxymethylglutaryl-CoA synthase
MNMSTHPKVGISDIQIYLPRFRIDLNTIVNQRAKEIGGSNIEKIFQRTLQKTGLLSMYFPEVWEDSVTMAAQAAFKLILRQKFNLSALRYFVTGTETGVDHSKPIGAYVLGILKKAGIKVPQSLSTFQTQHACAGGTVALLGISALLGFVGPSEESGIVMCSDIARYGKSTSAEMTQGAGAVAMLTETNPKLIELDLASAGYSSKDVDDFFRPLGSDIAKVKGSFSIRCYMEAMDSALQDHALRVKKTPAEVLENADMIALHVPYPKLPYDTMKFLLNKYLNKNDEQADEYLSQKGFFAMTEPVSKCGNIYTGSMYLSLAFLLKERFQKLGKKITGKNILMGSYGSGNTMVFLSGKIAPKAPEVIDSWDLDSIWNNREATIQEYENWVSSNGKDPESYETDLKDKMAHIGAKSFYLHRIREDGYREYQYQE